MIDALHITIEPQHITPGSQFDHFIVQISGDLWPEGKKKLHLDWRESYPRDMLKSELRTIFERLAWRIEQLARDAQKDKSP